jgi:Tn7-like transposition protein D
MHSWLADMLRDRPRCARPIQHLLLINFLGQRAQSFFEILLWVCQGVLRETNSHSAHSEFRHFHTVVPEHPFHAVQFAQPEVVTFAVSEPIKIGQKD